MQKSKLLLTCLALTGMNLAISGCSYPGVYKIDIQQGNVITQDMINQLRPGMSKQQVQFIMGNPLITDTFHPNRWDYLYSIQPGGGKRQQERVSLDFNDAGQLSELSGDFVPGASKDESLLSDTPETASDTPVETKASTESAASDEAEDTLNSIQKEIDDSKEATPPTPSTIDGDN
ncbi:UNVERIFIED_CONTAM: hypothetical protein GTU68_056389 [Idotea baltica]|nr:hypothetical protein [Idotea baltica]